MPRRPAASHPLPPATIKRVKSTPELQPANFKNRIAINNERNIVENGVEANRKMVTGKVEGDGSKYLHKKFKKVATLEDTSPPKARTSDDESTSPTGRYVCHYCGMACAKPSVLQKHIRAHTNERPFPCLPCGFAFKTKSNLYKHCRSRSHTKKMDDGSSGDEDDSSKSDVSVSATSNDSESTQKRIYKPKFHTAISFEEDRRPELEPLTIPPPAGTAQSTPSPFSGSSPSPEFLQRHISKLISDNQAIVDEVPWPLKTRYRDSPPLSPPVIRNGDSDAAGSHSKLLALALLKPQRSGTPDSDGPLNLTTKEPRKRSISESKPFGDSQLTKDHLLKSHSTGSIGERGSDRTDLYSSLSSRSSFSYPDSPDRSSINSPIRRDPPKTVLFSPGPLLGNTPLVEGLSKEVELPMLKRRKLDLRDLSLMGDDIMKSPGKSVHLFGGEVQINDPSAGRTKTLRIEPSRKEAYVEPLVRKQEHQVLTISKASHGVGGTLIQSSTTPLKSPVQERVVLPIKPSVMTPSISVPGLVAPVHVPLALSPISNISGYNPLTLPKASPTSGGGLVTILHGGKPIPYVPGMPGPQTLLPSPTLVPRIPEKQSVIVSSVRRNKSPDLPPKMPHHPPPPPAPSNPPTINLLLVDEEEKRISEAETRIAPTIKDTSSLTPVEVGEKKFLRPTSLPLKPGTYTPKKQLTTPHLMLVSPETPRPRKSYGQLYLNGHAYTYLGLKCSTRTFFCTLNKPQPIYVKLVPDQNKVSMYSNWICYDSNPHPLGLDPRKAMGLYDSRSTRTSSYTTANRNKEDLIAHSTYHFDKDQIDSKCDFDERNSSPDGISRKISKICDGGSKSNDDFTYNRGRGKGRYVCEDCGVRCKNPFMLKKHIRSHSDFRPYTCKNCAFSFKTKEKLSKHMKSKAHYKRCVDLGISPVPTISDEYPADENGYRKDGGGPTTPVDESEDETDEDDDIDGNDEDSEGNEGDDEREVAQSLLSLSEVTLETAHRQYVRAGLVSSSGRPRTYPYSLTSTNQVLETKSDKGGLVKVSDTWRGSDERPETPGVASPPVTTDCTSDSGRPMDLSSKTSPVLTPGARTPLTPVIPPVCGQAHLLKSICSTTEKTPSLNSSGLIEPAENHTLLQTYLTERAAHDSRIKHRQVCPEGVTIGGDMSAAKESALGVLAMTMSGGKPPSPKPSAPGGTTPSAAPSSSSSSKGGGGSKSAEFMPPASGPSVSFISSTEDGRSMCGVCNKVFNKPSQLRLHVNIHFFERPFRCESCAVSFRTKGHLQKHQRSLSHLNKVSMNSTFGTATSSNPRPFKCDDCVIAFRIHGHLAKHLRSKMHIMKLECLGKLPFGTYAELERSGMNMNDIDTTDCENSLESLQILAQKLYEKDPSKLGSWEPSNSISVGDSSSEDEPPPTPPHPSARALLISRPLVDSDDGLR